MRRAQIIAEIEESIAQLDRGDFVTEEQLRARLASERAARVKPRITQTPLLMLNPSKPTRSCPANSTSPRPCAASITTV
jgi:hypothetical protein